MNSIHLCANNLKSIKGGIENFRNSIYLKTINLDRNKLSSLYGLFCHNNGQNPLQNMTTLKLAYNQIREISAVDLNCMSNLRELHLQFNKIAFINLNSFAKLKNLKLLYINDNPFLPYPNMLNGLQNSLEHLSINFKKKIGFEKAIEMILLESRMHKLVTIDLSSSVFKKVNINLKDFLITSIKLVKLICYDCNINSVNFKYDNNRRSKYLNSYNSRLCSQNVNRSITFDFNYNEAKDCKTDQVKNKEFLNEQTNNSHNFLKLLVSFVQVENYYCKKFNIRGYQHVSWYNNYMKTVLMNTKNDLVHKKYLCSLIGYSRSDLVKHSSALIHLNYTFVFCIIKILIYS